MSTFIVPSGYKFDPSDQVLVCPYLLDKVIGKPLPCNGVVKEFDLYGIEDPRGLFEGTEEKIVYCYTPLKKKNKNSSRFVRMVGNCTWKGQDKGKPVYDKKGHHIGCKRSFTYLTKSKAKGGYNMQEYSLDGDYRHYLESHDCYVLCRITKKNLQKKEKLPQPERVNISERMPIDVHENCYWKNRVNNVGLEAADSEGFSTNESTITIGAEGVVQQQQQCDGIPNQNKNTAIELASSVPLDCTLSVTSAAAAAAPLPQLERGGSAGMPIDIADDDDDLMIPMEEDDESWCTNSFLGLEAADETTIGSFIDHDQMMMMMGVAEEDEHRKEHDSQDTTTGAAAREEQPNRIIYNRNMANESPASAQLPSWGLEFDAFDCTAPVASAASFAAMEQIDTIPYTTSGLGDIPFNESSLATMGDGDEFDSHLQLGSYDLWGLW